MGLSRSAPIEIPFPSASAPTRIGSFDGRRVTTIDGDNKPGSPGGESPEFVVGSYRPIARFNIKSLEKTLNISLVTTPPPETESDNDDTPVENAGDFTADDFIVGDFDPNDTDLG